jgi:hypothetical protein
MKKNSVQSIDQQIHAAAQQVAVAGNVSVTAIERFLHTAKESWAEDSSGRFSIADIHQHRIYGEAAKTALLALFDILVKSLPPEAVSVPKVDPETIRQRIEPMVKGLVQRNWREVALRELTRRTFILNFHGARAAIEAELSTGFLGTAWQIVWAFFGDYGLKPDEVEVGYDGISGGAFAHVRWAVYESHDPYCDVVVHEAAHLLHYLKPEQFGLRARRGQERFVDVEFRQRELFAYACEAYSRAILHRPCASRISFVEKMPEDATSFAEDHLDQVVALVLIAARARNGWRVIREATT